jgi:UDP-glucose 4-epimerase
MVVLVTGGSGFIGSHVTSKLVEKGHSVRVFDQRKPMHGSVSWFKGDLLNEKDVLEACEDVEYIYHLAAVADVNEALSHPELCLAVNETGTVNLLRAAGAKEVDRVILASTTWVYGRTEGVVDETTPIPMPDHIYTKTKIGQEQLVHAWYKHYGLPYTILRYDIPYGPSMRSNMAIAIFARKAMQKEAISVFGDGNQGRCFIYIEDLAEGNAAALKGSSENQIINLAGSEFVTINQVVQSLKAIFGDVKVEHKPSRPEDFKGARVSIAKAKRLLDWKPRTKFKQGLALYVRQLIKETKGH